jgi:flagellar biosynthesis/type III secretory pathway chaperone
LSANPIITELTKLLTLQEDLYDKSKKKTEVVKVGDVEGLKSIINEERKLITSIAAVQKAFIDQSKRFLHHHGISMDTPTLSDCLQKTNDQEKQVLTTLQSQIVNKAEQVRKQNELNQQLLKQSLAFVQMSIDLLSPDISTYNYERTGQNHSHEQPGRSLFDSNA